MKQAIETRRMVKWVFLSALAIPAFLLAASELGMFPWSQINCTQQQVDIRTGRILHTRHLMYLLIAERVEDSTLTKALTADDVANVTPEWHTVVTFSPGVRHSPNYIFHSAISQIQELAGCWEGGRFTPAARRASATRVLQLWQKSGSDDGARAFLRAISKLTFQDSDSLRKIDVGDLPL